jgi:hypothetical protein
MQDPGAAELTKLANAQSIAFSSEVDTGSRKKTRQNKSLV